MSFCKKYLKYKQKYFNLKNNQVGGTEFNVGDYITIKDERQDIIWIILKKNITHDGATKNITYNISTISTSSRIQNRLNISDDKIILFKSVEQQNKEEEEYELQKKKEEQEKIIERNTFKLSNYIYDEKVSIINLKKDTLIKYNEIIYRIIEQEYAFRGDGGYTNYYTLYNIQDGSNLIVSIYDLINSSADIVRKI